MKTSRHFGIAAAGVLALAAGAAGVVLLGVDGPPQLRGMISSDPLGLARGGYVYRRAHDVHTTLISIG